MLRSIFPTNTDRNLSTKTAKIIVNLAENCSPVASRRCHTICCSGRRRGRWWRHMTSAKQQTTVLDFETTLCFLFAYFYWDVRTFFGHVFGDKTWYLRLKNDFFSKPNQRVSVQCFHNMKCVKHHIHMKNLLVHQAVVKKDISTVHYHCCFKGCSIQTLRLQQYTHTLYTAHSERQSQTLELKAFFSSFL